MVDAAPSALPRAIADDEDLHRRIVDQWIVTDTAGRKRLSSAAYVPKSDSHCSAYVAAECTADAVLAPYTVDGTSVGAIAVGACRAHEYTIQRDVQADEHASHVHLVETKGLSKSAKRAIYRDLAAQTRWVVGSLTWDPPVAPAA